MILFLPNLLIPGGHKCNKVVRHKIGKNVYFGFIEDSD